MATREKPTFDQRIAEYVNSPLMTQRMRYGKHVSARIEGNFGIYRTRITQSDKLEGDCSCPSELWPCKHIYALRATWEANPDSFFDFDVWLKKLADEPQESLVEAIGNMVMASPGLLSVFGVPGFEEDDNCDEDEAYYE
ncbi:MAG TPA: SWIM zinc finger family protein [Lacipirellulaceae bacterium]|jgi:hypothetical protein|nr:SWIM zinc finger family protein [Lacipirellulaceae bacterium]